LCAASHSRVMRRVVAGRASLRGVMVMMAKRAGLHVAITLKSRPKPATVQPSQFPAFRAGRAAQADPGCSGATGVMFVGFVVARRRATIVMQRQLWRGVGAERMDDFAADGVHQEPARQARARAAPAATWSPDLATGCDPP